MAQNCQVVGLVMMDQLCGKGQQNYSLSLTACCRLSVGGNDQKSVRGKRKTSEDPACCLLFQSSPLVENLEQASRRLIVVEYDLSSYNLPLHKLISDDCIMVV